MRGAGALPPAVAGVGSRVGEAVRTVSPPRPPAPTQGNSARRASLIEQIRAGTQLRRPQDRPAVPRPATGRAPLMEQIHVGTQLRRVQTRTPARPAVAEVMARRRELSESSDEHSDESRISAELRAQHLYTQALGVF